MIPAWDKLWKAARPREEGAHIVAAMEAGVAFLLTGAGAAGYSPLAAAVAGAAWFAFPKPQWALLGVFAGILFSQSWASLSACSILGGVALLATLWYSARERPVPAGVRMLCIVLSQAVLLPFLYPPLDERFVLGLVSTALSAPAAAVMARGVRVLRLFLKGKRVTGADAVALALFLALFITAMAVAPPYVAAGALTALLTGACALCRVRSGAARELALTRLRLRDAAGVMREMACFAPAEGDFALAAGQMSGVSSAMERMGEPRRRMKKSRLRAETGAAALPKEGSPQTGDTMAIRRLDGGLLLLMSDGMGSGPAAHRESASAVALYGDLLSIGFDSEDALVSVNRLLLSTGEEAYATLDAARVNLASGSADFVKLGAPPAFILREGKVKTLYAEALPLGILPKADPGVSQASLKAGDAVVLMTDGLSEALGRDLLASIVELVGAANTAQDAAEALLARGAERGLADDMSVMVARFHPIAS